MARFCPIASGSDGNCVYVEMGGQAMLVDAGISGAQAERGLIGAGIEPRILTAIFVTHEHSDHTAGIGILSRRYNLPIYASGGTWAAIDKSVGRVTPQNKKRIAPGEGFHIGGISNGVFVTPFPVPHDAAEPVGYSFYDGATKITVATDIGEVTPILREAVSNSEVLLIESNHDLDMLKYGRYPVHLKRRILSEVGHLSNAECGRLLAELCRAEKGRKHIYLGHMSAENNRPTLAYETVSDILASGGVELGGDIKLYVARRRLAGNVLEI